MIFSAVAVWAVWIGVEEPLLVSVSATLSGLGEQCVSGVREILPEAEFDGVTGPGWHPPYHLAGIIETGQDGGLVDDNDHRTILRAGEQVNRKPRKRGSGLIPVRVEQL